MVMLVDKFRELFDLDLEAILKEMHLPEPVYERVLKIAITVTDLSLIELEKALAHQDIVQICKIAHEFKGTYGNMRIAPLYRLSIEIETTANIAGDMDKVRMLVEEFKKIFVFLKTVLEGACT